ncbi:M20/M25/M40 family metallo-hydrolase [Montanilutibacter psychrotolerans]|nr:M20/M25/M40 family metallo-hydrolase [Lysobacter psychrotolerans]
MADHSSAAMTIAAIRPASRLEGVVAMAAFADGDGDGDGDGAAMVSRAWWWASIVARPAGVVRYPAPMHYRCLPSPLLTALLLLLPLACSRAPTAQQQAGAARIEADVRALSHDRFEGRLTASRGFEGAADHVVRRMQALGLEPAGDAGGWLQAVPLLRATRIEHGGELRVRRDGRDRALRWQSDFLPEPSVDHAVAQVEAPAVFVGHGVRVAGRDDYAGLDLRGRIAVLLDGAPVGLDPVSDALHASRQAKLREAARHGAVGAVFLRRDDDERAWPWSRIAAHWHEPAMQLRGRDDRGLDSLPGLRVVAVVRAGAADAVLAGSGTDAATLFQAGRDGRVRAFPLPGTLRLSARNAIDRVQSHNVVGRLRGSDPGLNDEHVVLSAHLDHLGIAGGRIHGGAVDNALGVAVMLESARVLATQPHRPRRSVLFLATTGEEQGLLGARWFVRAAPRGALISNLNLDMPVLAVATDDVGVAGAALSDLRQPLHDAARELDVSVSADPLPQYAMFQRSDQHAFARAGIPALYLFGGVDASSWREDARAGFTRFLGQRYHDVDDGPDQAIHWPDAERLARLVARTGARVADAPQRPAWVATAGYGGTVPDTPDTQR